MKIVKKCKGCNKDIFLYPSQLKMKTFCSRKCRYQSSIEKLQCRQCGKEFIKSKYEIKRGSNKYCSKKCTGLSQRNRKLLDCIECGMTFQIKNSHFKRTNGKYCSVKCMNKNRENKIECKCAKCKKIFYRIPSLTFRKNTRCQSKWFCNQNCYMNYHGPTSIEESVEKALLLLNITFEKQKRITISNCEKIKGMKRITFVDFFIYPNICLYVDGDYWHSLPKVIEKDKIINEKLPKLGYQVKRLREKDINIGEDKIIELIQLSGITNLKNQS